MRLDLSRPDIVYGLIWGFSVSILLIFDFNYTSPLQEEILFLIISNIISFWLIYKIMKFILNAKSSDSSIKLTEFEVYCLYRYCKLVFYIWVTLYFLSIFFSSGIPIIWAIIDDPKTYVDFGIPSFSGLLNMIRAFLFSIGLIIFFHNRKRRMLIIPFILFLSGMAELSRGNLTVLILHGFGIYLLYSKNIFPIITKFLIFALIYFIMFGLIGDIRGNSSIAQSFYNEDSIFNFLPGGFFWAITYIISPLNNINYAYSLGIEPLMYPYFSTQPIFPTIIRDIIFQTSEYPIQLANEAFNATTFYSPLLADFGILGAFTVVIFLQFIVAYTHIKATQGSIFNILFYPTLFMSVVLSIFYMFFFSLIVLMYPLMIYSYLIFKSSIKFKYKNKLVNR